VKRNGVTVRIGQGRHHREFHAVRGSLPNTVQRRVRNWMAHFLVGSGLARVYSFFRKGSQPRGVS
jgi:hypothetical protein